MFCAYKCKIANKEYFVQKMSFVRPRHSGKYIFVQKAKDVELCRSCNNGCTPNQSKFACYRPLKSVTYKIIPVYVPNYQLLTHFATYQAQNNLSCRNLIKIWTSFIIKAVEMKDITLKKVHVCMLYSYIH